jgi:hypothetical protein
LPPRDARKAGYLRDVAASTHELAAVRIVAEPGVSLERVELPAADVSLDDADVHGLAVPEEVASDVAALRISPAPCLKASDTAIMHQGPTSPNSAVTGHRFE